jgi:hypothetical protein
MTTIPLPERRGARTRAAAAGSAEGNVLAKASHRAAGLLGLNGAALARVLGLSEATVSRIGRGERPLSPASKEGELAVRLYRSLDALVGNDPTRRLAWMRSPNAALNGVPAELILSAQGLVATVAYLDAMRAPL